MNSTTNLAFSVNTSYNNRGNSIHLNRVQAPRFDNKHFIIQMKQALILRENILASGMEVSDIQKACLISKNIARR